MIKQLINWFRTPDPLQQEALAKIERIERKYSGFRRYLNEANAIIEPLIPNKYEANDILHVPAEHYDRALELLKRAYKEKGDVIPPGQKVLTFMGPHGEIRLVRIAG